MFIKLKLKSKQNNVKIRFNKFKQISFLLIIDQNNLKKDKLALLVLLLSKDK